MGAGFVLKQNDKGEFFFNLTAGNGEIILASQTYTSKESANAGIASVKKNATLDEQFERLTAKNGQPYFNLKASNAQIIGKSEMYSSPSAMENGIASVKKNAPAAPIKDATA